MQSLEEFRPAETSSFRIRNEKKKRAFRSIRRQIIQQTLQQEMKQGMYLKYAEYKDQNILARNIDSLLEPDQDLSKIHISLRFLRQVSGEGTNKILKYLNSESLDLLFQLIIKLARSFPSNTLLMIDGIWLIANLTTEIDKLILEQFLVRYGPLKVFKKLLNRSTRDKDFPLLFEIILHFCANVGGFGPTFVEMVLDVDLIDFLKEIKTHEASLFEEKKESILFLLRNLAPVLIHGFISEVNPDSKMQAKFMTKCAISCIQECDKNEEILLLEDALIVLEVTTNNQVYMKLAKEAYIEQNIVDLLLNLPEQSSLVHPCLQIIVNFTCFYNEDYYFTSDIPLLLLKFFENPDLSVKVRFSAGLALANICGNSKREKQITELAFQQEMQTAILNLLKPENEFKIIKQTSRLVDNMLQFGEPQIAIEFMHSKILLRMSQLLAVNNRRKFNRNALNCLHNVCVNSEILGDPGMKEIQNVVSDSLDELDDLCKKDESKLGMFMKVTEMLGLRRGDDQECKEEGIIL